MSEVGVAAVTVARISKVVPSRSANSTILFASDGEKLVPVIVTVVPDGPLVGAKLEIAGAGTVKLPLLVPVRPPTVTLTGPVAAVIGTLVESDVAVAEVTVAVTPLNLTVLLAAVVLKLVPLIVTAVPPMPLDGDSPVTPGETEKLMALVAVLPATVTVMVPVVAPLGTVTDKEVPDALATVAAVPLNFTVLLAAVVLKPLPLIVTVAPTGPLAGVKLEIAGSTVKLLALVADWPVTVTVNGPLGTPALEDGIVTEIPVSDHVVAVSAVPASCTVLVLCVAPKCVPEIATEVPAAPLAGVNPLIVGGGMPTV